MDASFAAEGNRPTPEAPVAPTQPLALRRASVVAAASTGHAHWQQGASVPTPGGAGWTLRRVRIHGPQPRTPVLRPPPSVAQVRSFFQPKLKIGAVNDPLEHEADRAADQVLRTQDQRPPGDPSLARDDDPRASPVGDRSRDREDALRREASVGELQDQPSPSSLVRVTVDPLDAVGLTTMRRDIGREEILEQLVQVYLSDEETLQRQVDEPEDEEEASGEEILMQSKPAGPPPTQLGGALESAVHSLDGGGHPLPVAVREYMEPRFGHDFSNVRVHADARAGEVTRLANARAFTIGPNVAFASGEYAPEGSTAGLRLLAHELTHVIQQGQAGPRLQRKLVVGGKPYTPSAKYLTFLDSSFGPAMKEFVEQMHNGGSPPVYSFNSYEQMGYEVRIRAEAIKGIEDVHKGCCNYYDSAHPPYLDSTYWDHVGTGVNFKLKSPLPTGKEPSDAVEAIFAPGAGTRLECRAMSRAIEYRSMLKGLGAAKFNAQFPGGAGIDISLNPPYPLIAGPDHKYEIITVASTSAILPGDRVYFKNFRDYRTRVPGGFWQGENAIALGGGKFRGFGVAALSEHDMNLELVDRYNRDGSPPLSKTVADLVADGGGLQFTPVIRPIISRIVP
jgi:hypothetical protein